MGFGQCMTSDIAENNTVKLGACQQHQNWFGDFIFNIGAGYIFCGIWNDLQQFLIAPYF